MANGVQTSIVNADTCNGGSHKITVEVSGNHHVIKRDGSILIDAYDSSHSFGYVGLATNRMAGRFDNFTVVADSDGDGMPDCIDGCRDDPGKIVPGICGCGVPDVDSDNDGIFDCNDTCPNSDLNPTIVIDGCDTEVENHLLGSGCTITDKIAECAKGASNHGEFVSCLAHLTNDLKRDGIITGKEKGKIQRCGAQADIP